MTRFVVSSLSIIGNNHAEGLHRYKCENFKSDFEYAAVKDITPIFKCVECHKTPEKEFDKSVTKRFQNTYRFCDGHMNILCLLYWKGVYPHKYMDSWKRFNNKTSLLGKKKIYSNLMEGITHATYKHTQKKSWRDFGRQKTGQ